MYKVLFLALLVGFCFIHQTISAKSNLIVQTTEGRYQGRIAYNGVRMFLGIPFAKPPVGNLRWKRAVGPANFKGLRNATISGPCCPQSGLFKNLTVQESEDCLTLDVYTPKKAKAGDLLPVKVYIHGGGFSANSAALYPGEDLSAQESAVVIVINYRLSYQGFMVFSPILKEDNGVVNFGITDQQLALKWIQKNIHQFGGNKKNVVIFGNSAGGLSVLIHYTLPTSKDLFKVGVAESAGPWNIITSKTAATINDPLAARFGCYDNVTSKVNMSCMRQVPWQSIYNYTWAAAQPVFDNLIERPIAKSYSNNKYLKKAKEGTPIIIGTAAYEGNQFAWLALRIVTRNPHPPLVANYTQFANILKNSLALDNTTLSSVLSYYSNFSVNGNYYVSLREALGDYGIKCGNILTAYNALKGLGANVYNYYFTHNTADWRYTELNATHTVEVPYLFLSNGTFFEAHFTSAEQKLAKNFVRYVTNFQNSKNPNTPSMKKKWPVFSKNKASTLDVDVKLKKMKLPVPKGCKLFWNNVVKKPSPRSSNSASESPFAKFTTDPEAISLNLFHG